jgi:hypothetical protein
MKNWKASVMECWDEIKPRILLLEAIDNSLKPSLQLCTWVSADAKGREVGEPAAPRDELEPTGIPRRQPLLHLLHKK